MRTRLVPRTNKQKGTRLEVPSLQAHYSDRRVVTSAGPALRRAQQEYDFNRSRQGKNRRITLWPNPLTRPKPRGLLSGTTIRDTLIGVLRPLLKTPAPDKTVEPTKAHGLLLIQMKGKDSKKPSVRPIHIPLETAERSPPRSRVPLRPAGQSLPRSRVADLPSSR